MKSYHKYIILSFLLVGLVSLQFCSSAARKKTSTSKQEQQFNRADKPEPGTPPEIALPESEKVTLENGLDIVLVTQSELPMVVMEIVVNTGSATDPLPQTGLADFTAAMLDEGTESRSSLQIAEDADFLGAQLNTGANWDYSYVKLTTLNKHLDPAMDVFTDVILHSNFPQEEFDRVRQERLNSLLQKQDRPNTIATDVFYKVIYTDQHPYGTPDEGTEESLNALTVNDLQAFKEKYYQPNNATLFVVGDMTMDELLPLVGEKFGAWEASDNEFFGVPEIPDTDFSNIYVIDKPGAPQSQIRIGHPGLHRNNPDYPAVQVMNEILGGSFSSRINMNLREDKGFTYGARSIFVYRKGLGPFIAYSGVKTSTTDSAVVEFMKEIQGMTERPVADTELNKAKSALTLSLARETETLNQILDFQIDEVVYNLPEGHINQYVTAVRHLTKDDIQRVAEKYLHLDNMAIVIVGDAETITPKLQSLGYGEVIELDASGNPVN